MSFYEAWKFTYDTFRIFQDFEISWKSISWILQDISEIFWANYQSKVDFFHKYSLHISSYSPKVYNSASRWQYHFLREFSPFLGGGVPLSPTSLRHCMILLLWRGIFFLRETHFFRDLHFSIDILPNLYSFLCRGFSFLWKPIVHYSGNKTDNTDKLLE